jgi:hypothetical protein
MRSVVDGDIKTRLEKREEAKKIEYSLEYHDSSII